MTEKIIPCKWCGKGTTMLGTKCCDGCWELYHRVSDAEGIALVKKMIGCKCERK